MKLLLLMTTGMSLKRWDELGQLSRELAIYQRLGEEIGHIYIYSYGKNEEKYCLDYSHISVLSKFNFIPQWEFFPGRVLKYLNYLYNFFSIIFRAKLFKKIDIIKTNQFIGSGFGSIIKNIFKCRLFIRMGFYHTFDKERFSSDRLYFRRIKQERKYFKEANGIIVTNKDAFEFIHEQYNIDNKKIHLIPNFIDSNVFKPIDNIVKKYDILFVGRHIEIKNLKNLLYAVKKLNLKVLFIGRGVLKNDLELIARENNINLEIIDRVDNYELPEYYNSARIFVLPSLYEGNPKVLLEAFACGCACIGSDVRGINNIIIHEKNGLLCKTDSKSICETVRILIENETLKNKIRKNARAFIEENYSIDKILNQEITIYKNT